MRGERPADWLAPGEALRRIVAAVEPLGAEERCLLDCVGRVLAEDVAAPVDLPPWDNSAMDGFAVRADDVRGATRERPVVLPVVDDVPAGGFPARPVGPGQAARVMTGAPVPGGVDTVVRVEHTDGGRELGTASARVAIFSDADVGRHIRPRGEDVRCGDVVLRAGEVLRAGSIGEAAALGREGLAVVRRPVVAVLASGDELVEVERYVEVLGGRRIVSSNSYTLAAQLAESGMEARVLGIARDTRESLREHLQRARGCDALVTTAGVSVGEHDHVRAVLEEMETRVEFWRMRARPGSAFAFGHVGGLGGIPWFGLPGNPVSTAVTFELFVRPALLRMAGHARIYSPVVQATLRDAYAAKGELMHFPRVRLERTEDGLVASLTGAQGSGVATSMAAADGLAIIPAGAELSPKDGVRVMMLGGAPPVEEPYF